MSVKALGKHEVGDIEPLSQLMRSIKARCLPSSPREGDDMARLYRQRLANERVELLDARGIPKDDAIRARCEDRSLNWDTIQAAKRVQRDRIARGDGPKRHAPGLLFLAGDYGGGKSTALSWCVAQSTKTAHYVHASEVSQTKQWGDGAWLWKRWRSVDVLAIDELSDETGDTNPDAIIVLVLNRWDRTGGLTLLAGNLNRTKMTERYLSGENWRKLNDRLIIQRVPWMFDAIGPTRIERAMGAK